MAFLGLMAFGLNLIRQTYGRIRRPLFEAFGSDRYSYLALNELDRKLRKYVDFTGGSFIEAGGNDGLSQSNSYWFERFRGWRGLLIEAVPEQAALCRQNRPKAEVVNAALVADANIKSVKIKSARLMAFIPGTRTVDEEAAHLKAAMEVQGMTEVPEIEVPATTLATILDRRGAKPADLFSLDVEGYEVPVLEGMNVERHRPRWILVETRNLPQVLAVLKGHYRQIDQFSHHDFLLATNHPL